MKYKGLQISPVELEAVLVTHEKVLDAAVVGVPDPDLPGNEIPRAFIVRKPGRGQVSVEEIHRLVRGQLAAYKQLRGGVQFIDQVPRNPSGKILRRVLRDQYILRAKSKI